MNENLKPAMATSTDNPGPSAPAPHTMAEAEMREHLDAGRATPLSDDPRHAIFVHYDDTWWINSPLGFIEITDQPQKTKLDRWHTRLTTGGLWA